MLHTASLHLTLSLVFISMPTYISFIISIKFTMISRVCNSLYCFVHLWFFKFVILFYKLYGDCHSLKNQRTKIVSTINSFESSEYFVVVSFSNYKIFFACGWLYVRYCTFETQVFTRFHFWIQNITHFITRNDIYPSI